MKLSELLKNVEVLNILGNEDIEISGVNIDSRRIEAGHLFVAIPGTQTDGHKFIPKAIEQGAVAVLCEYFPNKREPGITYIAVESTEDCVG
jgi:UDP-N-acetylmuramoyl-L-alanyl-D-glutamate--2,6-diaminopimelate ligase